MNKERKAMRQDIIEYVAGLPEGQLGFGTFVSKVGTKYVHGYYYDCNGSFCCTKETIEDFYYAHIMRVASDCPNNY